MYYQTGHLPYYKDGMFPFMEMKESEEDETSEAYVLRPMNVLIIVFASQKDPTESYPLDLQNTVTCTDTKILVLCLACSLYVVCA